ncbi:MAG: alpha/beta fold hydrolase, partial [Chloroflexota bacterium]
MTAARTRSPRLAVSLGLAVLVAALGAPLVARAQEAIPLQPVDDPTFGVSTVVPEGWPLISPGVRARKPDASDHVLLGVQSAPIPVAQLWPAILPQLMLKTPPDPIGTRDTAAFSWTLYQVDIKAPYGEVRVDLGTAEKDGKTYLVLLQSPLEGADVLREAVFLPAVDTLKPLAPEATPDPATLPYAVEDVSFPGGADGVNLAGTLTTPRTPGPHPGIVLVSGSGPQDRDESLLPIAAIKPFALLADALTRAGIAVLRYDDRGTAKSTGSYANAGLADLTADAAAAVAYLRARPEIDPAKVGLLGHSEGGIILASLLEQGAPLAFGVSMAGPAAKGADLLVAQNGAILRSQGAAPEDVARAETYARTLYDALLAGDLDAAKAAATEFFGGYWDRQPKDTQAALGDRAAFVDRQVEQATTGATAPEFLDILRSDPNPG